MEKVTKASIVLWCAFFAFGCSGDESMEAVPLEEEASRITLFIPGAEEVRVYSTATADENRIEDCFVVAFKDGYKNSEMVNVAGIMANGQATALLPQLSIKLDPGDTVYVVCNTGLTALPAGIASITANDINAKFPPGKAYYFSGEALPMSGSTVWSPTASSTVTLTRAVAKVQVQLGETFSIAEFDAMPFPASLYHDQPGTFPDPDMNLITENISLCEFAVLNHAGKSDILQPSSGLSRKLSDSTGFYGTFEKPLRLMQYASADEMAVYVSEYPNSTTDCEGLTIPDHEFRDKRQHLLLMERNVDFIPNVVYMAGIWRLDFYDAASKKYLDIKRNHTYTFTINRIRSLPYFAFGPFQFLKDLGVNDFSPASSNIEYTIAVEDDWANSIYSNGQYALAVSTDTINDANVHLPFKVKAYMPAGINVNNSSSQHIMFARDRIGNIPNYPTNNSNNAFRIVYTYQGAAYYNSNGEFPLLTDGTTNVYTFAWNPSGLNAEYFDNGSLYIYLGNIWKRIPIMLTATTP